MGKLRLMIADNSEDFRLALEKKLCGEYDIHHCKDGNEALDYARTQKPDVIVLDLMLAKLDGITLLYELQKSNVLPMVLATTRLDNQYVYDSAEELGVGYLMRKPCDPAAVAMRVRDLCRKLSPKDELIDNPEAYVTELLLNMDLSQRHKGFFYLRDAILKKADNPEMSITKELYPQVGSKYGSNHDQVEHSIRTAIGRAWEKKKGSTWEAFFAEADDSIPRPSNGTVISRLSDDLRRKTGAQ